MDNLKREPLPKELFKKGTKVIDEFNGVKAVDMEKLLSNCEYIFNKYNKALHKYDEE